MTTIRGLKHRPWLASAAAVAVIAAILLVIPISYERVVGQEVVLELSGQGLDMSRVADVAKEFKAVLGAGEVMVDARDDGSDTRYALRAKVPAKSGARAAALARAFATGLSEKGYQASASATPIKERVSGSVYAYAQDRVITISMDGKSAAELEAEIRQRLTEAGVPDANVSVTDSDGKRKVGIDVRQVRDGANAPSETEHPIPQVVLTKNGAPAVGHGFTVEVRKKKDPSGTTLSVEVHDGARSATAEVRNPEALSDDALAAAVESQLRQAGIESRVVVTNGKIEVGPKPSGQ